MSINNSNKNKKHVFALVVAFSMTALVAVAMIALGANALLNKSVTPAEAAPAATEVNVPDGATVDQLQAAITEYQAREVQYQDQLSQAADQLNQANAEVQQYQNLFMQLQQMGVIQVDANGQVTVTQPQFGLGHHEEHGLFGDGD